MFEASRASRRFTRTSNRALLAAGVLAAGLGAGLTATPAAHADVIGPITFDSQSDFDNNFTIVASQSTNSFQVSSGELRVSDGPLHKITNGAYAVVQQSGGSTTFDASQITVGTHVDDENSHNASLGHGRHYGPTLLGATDRTATLQAGATDSGSSLAILRIHDITADHANQFSTISSSPITGGSGELNGRIVFTASNINSATNTADLTAQYFDDTAPSTAAATVTVPNYDLAAHGLSAVGEVGLARTGGRNRVAIFDNYQVDYTPGALVPEPASLALLGLGGLTLLGRRRRRGRR